MVATSVRAHRRFTADEYERMIALGIPTHDGYHFTFEEFVRLFDVGILADDERLELIEGEIIEMPPPGPPHANAVRHLTRLLTRLVPEEFMVDVQNPHRLRGNSTPLPDLAVVRDREYDTLPSEADVLLVIEVSDSTLRYDRGHKLRMYARVGIPEVWIVNIGAREIERYTEPQGETYGQRATARPDETLASTTVPEIVIPVSDVFR